MLRIAALAALDLVLVLLVAFAPKLYAAQRLITPEFEAKVIHVDDGDTVRVLRADGSQTRVRLANIDAPEASHGRCRPGQPYSAQSTQVLKQMVLGKMVRLQCHELDRYDRSICDLQMGATTANRELVRAGLAWANRSDPRYLRDREVAAAEAQARGNRAGLWADRSPVPPWEWRRTEWSQPSCKA